MLLEEEIPRFQEGFAELQTCNLTVAIKNRDC